MLYAALGDSISIDDYTGVDGGGAASQLARMLNVDRFVNLTRDGNTTSGVLDDIERIGGRPDVVTLTAGGNDFLLAAFLGANPATAEGRAHLVDEPLRNLARAADMLQAFRRRVVLNTVYDPTDGNNGLAGQMGLPASFRPAFESLNDGIRALARGRSFLLADLEALFRGHGIGAPETWIVRDIEPNLAGATAIATEWNRLLCEPGANGHIV